MKSISWGVRGGNAPFLVYPGPAPIVCSLRCCQGPLQNIRPSVQGAQGFDSKFLLLTFESVHPSASDRDIKAAYKRLSKKYHPDKNKDSGAEAKFVEIAQGENLCACCGLAMKLKPPCPQRTKCCQTKPYVHTSICIFLITDICQKRQIYDRHGEVSKRHLHARF